MINIPDAKIFNAIMQVQRGGKIDMFNVPLVSWYLKSVKETDAAIWIESHRAEYMQGCIEGFKNNVQEIKNIVNK